MGDVAEVAKKGSVMEGFVCPTRDRSSLLPTPSTHTQTHTQNYARGGSSYWIHKPQTLQRHAVLKYGSGTFYLCAIFYFLCYVCIMTESSLEATGK